MFRMKVRASYLVMAVILPGCGGLAIDDLVEGSSGNDNGHKPVSDKCAHREGATEALRAEEMRRLAEREPSPEVRADLLRMAHGWEAMARRRARLEATLTHSES